LKKGIKAKSKGFWQSLPPFFVIIIAIVVATLDFPKWIF